MTTIRVSVPATGPDADAGFLVGVGDCPRSPCTQQWVESGGVTLFEVPAGTYAVQLTDVASNCTLSGTNPVLVTTSPGSATEVTFHGDLYRPACRSGHCTHDGHKPRRFIHRRERNGV